MPAHTHTHWHTNTHTNKGSLMDKHTPTIRTLLVVGSNWQTCVFVRYSALQNIFYTEKKHMVASRVDVTPKTSETCCKARLSAIITAAAVKAAVVLSEVCESHKIFAEKNVKMQHNTATTNVGHPVYLKLYLNCYWTVNFNRGTLTVCQRC